MMREGMWSRLARRSAQSLLLCLPMAAFAADVPKDAKHEGAASCASSLCHGSSRPLEAHGVLQNEYVTWSQFDPHSSAYRVLLNARSRQMAARLRIGPAEKAPQCLACHAEVVPAAQRSPRHQLSDGVACESCHGPSSKWLPTHHQSPAVTHADNLARGLAALERPAVRAETCTACHVGDATRYASHAMMAAGHPRLVFDLETYGELWRTSGGREHYRKGPGKAAPAPEIWVAGLVTATRRQLDLVGQHAGRGGMTDFGVYACHSCHRDLRVAAFGGGTVAADPLTGAPGELRLQDGNARMLIVVAQSLGIATQDFTAAWTRAQSAVNREPARSAAAVAAVRSALARLGVSLGSQRWQTAERQRVFDGLMRAARGGAFPDPAAAEQAAMGMVMMLAELDLDRARKAQIDQLFATLRDENTFDRARFARVLAQLDRGAERPAGVPRGP
jgi:hypothetical protein